MHVYQYYSQIFLALREGFSFNILIRMTVRRHSERSEESLYLSFGDPSARLQLSQHNRTS